MAHDVFISYSSKDKAVADLVVGAVENAGLRCWVAPRDVRPGETWPTEIVSAIRACHAMVLILSEHANSSEHVRREIGHACKFGLVIVPLRIENVSPQGDLEYFLSSSHWLDAIPAVKSTHLVRLVGTLKAILQRPLPEQGWSPEMIRAFGTLPATKGDSSQLRSRLILAFAVCAVALMVWAVLSTMPSSGSSNKTSSASADSKKTEPAPPQTPPAPVPVAKPFYATVNGRGPSGFDYRELDHFRLADQIAAKVDAVSKKTIAQWQTDAKAGVPVAQYLLGLKSYGEGDFTTARTFFDAAAEHGDAAAMCMISQQYRDGSGVAADDAQARSWLLKSVSAGDPRAQWLLGADYQDGSGVKQDFALAASWYLSSAKQGYIPAMISYGEATIAGDGVTKNVENGEKWYASAAKAGDATTWRSIAASYENLDDSFSPKAFQWYSKAADAGDADSLEIVAEDYYAGIGVAVNYTAAHDKLLAAILAGTTRKARAYYFLGNLLMNGLGRTAEPVPAHQFYLKAAAGGDCNGMVSLAVDFYQGRGTPKDDVAGDEWVSRSVAKATKIEDGDCLYRCATAKWEHQHGAKMPFPSSKSTAAEGDDALVISWLKLAAQFESDDAIAWLKQ